MTDVKKCLVGSFSSPQPYLLTLRINGAAKVESLDQINIRAHGLGIVIATGDDCADAIAFNSTRYVEPGGAELRYFCHDNANTLGVTAIKV
jgi:hypothetical protein